MVIELASGPFLVIEIGYRSPNSNVHEKFRKFCGPADPVCTHLMKIIHAKLFNSSSKTFRQSHEN